MPIDSRFDAAEDSSPFLVTSPREILSLLRSLEKERALLQMHIPGRPVSVITTILELDERRNLIVVDNSREDTINQSMIAAEEVSFETALHKIRILFSTPKVTAGRHGQQSALMFDIPTELTRLQRRDYYRVDVPLSNPTLCSFPLPGNVDTPRISLTLEDLSCGGMLVIDNDQVLDCTIGTLYTDCRLQLPDNEILTVTAQVRRNLDETLSNDRKTHRVGFAFVDLPNTSLIALQRHIGKIERKLTARNKGFD